MHSRMMKFFIILLSLLTFSTASSGFYSKSPVLELSARNFKKEVLQNGNVTVVEFYAPWCGHCKNLKSEYVKSAKMLKGLARVAAVNCDNPINKELCARYKIEGFPTIKVFQPAKLTDVDFKNAIEGEELPIRRPRVYPYNGPRTAMAINTFAIGKLRNYAASLASEATVMWLKPNLIPRILMLPGKKYKSKSIAPLFKVLSREYFGKMRFAYVPRRVDGAWNLLGLAAPEESQLVYMSDDKEAMVYNGAMTKKAIKRFLDEQYELEMIRRDHTSVPRRPERENAAHGLEWITEDAQETEMEHVAEYRAKSDHERKLQEAAAEEARKRLGKEPHKRQSSEKATSAQSTTKAPSSKEVPNQEWEEAVEFEYSGDENDSEEVSEGAHSGNDDGHADLDGGDDAVNEDDSAEAADDETVKEVKLDEIEIDLAPEDIVEEGPEAVQSYLASVSAARESLLAKQPATAASADKPGVTPESKKYHALESMDAVIDNCFNGGRSCLLLTCPNEEFRTRDILVLARALERIPRVVKQGMYFHLVIDDPEIHPDIAQFVEDLGLSPYEKQRKAKDGSTQHEAGVLYIDGKRRKYGIHREDFTAVEIAKFALAGFNRKLEVHAIPEKYVFWVTEERLQYLDAMEEAAKESAKHDDL